MAGIFSLVFLLCFLPALSVAGSLGKYSDGAESQREQVMTADDVEKNLNYKIGEAVKLINELPLERRIELKVHYLKKIESALDKYSRLEAAYYQGIVAGVDWESRQ